MYMYACLLKLLFPDFAAALENPMKFVSRALEMMALGTKENDTEEVRVSKLATPLSLSHLASQEPDSGGVKKTKSISSGPSDSQISRPSIASLGDDKLPQPGSRKASVVPPELETQVIV